MPVGSIGSAPVVHQNRIDPEKSVDKGSKLNDGEVLVEPATNYVVTQPIEPNGVLHQTMQELGVRVHSLAEACRTTSTANDVLYPKRWEKFAHDFDGLAQDIQGFQGDGKHNDQDSIGQLVQTNRSATQIVQKAFDLTTAVSKELSQEPLTGVRRSLILIVGAALLAACTVLSGALCGMVTMNPVGFAVCLAAGIGGAALILKNSLPTPEEKKAAKEMGQSLNDDFIEREFLEQLKEGLQKVLQTASQSPELVKQVEQPTPTQPGTSPIPPAAFA